MNYLHLAENPTGKTYEQFIKLLCDLSDTFYFVTRKELDYNKGVIEQFLPYLVETYKSQRWAGTVTGGPAATIYVIKVNNETCKLLQQFSNSLYGWVAPKLPEDLAFMKNGNLLFSCTTHEEMGCFEVNEQEQQLIQQIKGLKIDW